MTLKVVKYPGGLDKPIPFFVPGGGIGLLNDQNSIDQGIERHKKYISNAWNKKMYLLLNHYGIDSHEPLCWYSLSFCLAHDHVRGFRIAKLGEKGRGRPRNGLLSRKPLRSINKRKAGRPSTWIWRGKERRLLDIVEKGRTLLKQQNKKVTNENALYEMYCLMIVAPLIKQKQVTVAANTRITLRKLARQHAKRLMEAKKAVQKSNEK